MCVHKYAHLLLIISLLLFGVQLFEASYQSDSTLAVARSPFHSQDQSTGGLEGSGEVEDAEGETEFDFIFLTDPNLSVKHSEGRCLTDTTPSPLQAFGSNLFRPPAQGLA